MPRRPRADEAGGLYHALNRGNARQTIFRKDADYEAFEKILSEGLELYDVSLFSFQLMPNHWHLVLRPNRDGAMSDFLRWVTATHTMRYHAHYHTSGQGHVYQGQTKRTGIISYAGSIGHQGKARISSIVDPAIAQGVYRAKVEVFNKATGEWVAKGPASTFFPDAWSRGQALHEVRGAFGNQLPRAPHWPPNYFEGLSPSGVRIGGYLDNLGNINTAFPIY
ncbi:MAG: EndoU domain-containing protein [Pirellulaceae bacterium]|nr:EndoU domain-containing protein [Pirellulaceae bacterium]